MQVSNVHFFRPQQEVVRPNAKLTPKLPKKYEVDEGGGSKVQTYLGQLLHLW